MRNNFLKGPVNPANVFDSMEYNREFRKIHPEYFDPEGLLVFTGPQGSGKTLSAVQYCKKILERYPAALFCSNVAIKGLEDRTIPYEGIRSLSRLQNGYGGVLYLIDEIHLEWNSLESKNISVEEMTEFAQQRKQRKHIVGTSQVFMRLAKPLREQIKQVVLCRSFMRYVQSNTLIDGTTAYEEDGKLICQSSGSYVWFHSPALYDCYDTYAKMQRYGREWENREGVQKPNIYDGSGSVKYKRTRI